jgi:WD40 repeat protein
VPVRVWDLDADTVRELPVPAGVNDLCFSPDSKRLAAACADGQVRFWDAGTGDAAGAPLVLSANEPATTVSFHPDGRRVLTTTSLALRQWDAAGHRAGPGVDAPEKAFRCAGYSADGTRFCATSAGVNGWWAVYETATGRELLRQINTIVASIHLSPDGTRVVLGENACRAEVWDLRGANLPFVLTGHQRQVSVAALSPDGRAVLAADDDGRVRLSLVAGGSALPPFALPFTGKRETWVRQDKYFTADGIRCLAVSPDGRRLFAAGWDRNGLLVEAADGAVRGEFRGHEGVITAAAFTPDGTRLLTGGADRTARLWDAATCRLLQTWALPAAVRYLCLSPDGSRAIVQPANQGCLLDLGGATGGGLAADHLWGLSRGAVFLPDGKGVLVGQAFDVGLWDAATGQFTATPLRQTSSISAVAVDAEGRRAATGAWNIGQIWDLRTSTPVGPPLRHRGREHEDRFKAMVFAPDGRLVAGLAFDGEVRFWDAATGRPVGPPLYVPGTGNALAFQADGAVLFAASSTARVYRWRVPRPVTEDAGRLMLRTQVLTGMEMDADGVVRLLAPDAWRERRRQLEALDAGAER